MPSPSVEVGARAWVRAQALRDALVEAAVTLEPAGVDLLAIKGVYMVHVLGVDPNERDMQDADALVVRGGFGRAVRELEATGRWSATQGWSARSMVRRDRIGGAIDLHRLPLPPFFGAMRTSRLLRRASRHPAFGHKVLVPDCEDAAVMAIAHFVKDCLPDGGRLRLVRDLRWLSERGNVDAKRVATRLREHGLARVGMVAFLALDRTDGEWGPWLDALGPNATERSVLTAAVNAIVRLAPLFPDAAFLIVRSVGDSTVRGLAGLLATLARLGRDRIMLPFSSKSVPERETGT